MHGCIYIYYRYCHLKGSSLLLLDAWEVRMDNLTFPWASVSARRKIDCTSAIKSTIECKSSLHISLQVLFGSEGHSDGLFNFPENIAIDDSNTVLYISDYYNN